MKSIEFNEWLENKFGNAAFKIIQNIRNSQPSRKVKSSGANVPGFYPSKKMGVTIQFESHKLELAGIYEKEHDPNVIEYYDQPPSFPIKYDLPEGFKKKTTGHLYTADFFTIENDWIGWEEWKTEEELIRLSQKNSNRYRKDENGEWRCPPAEEYAKQFGLSFRIRSSKEINWIFQRNIRFLEDYLLDENPSVTSEAAMIIKKLIKSKPSIMLEELLNDQSSYTADDIYTLMALDEIYVDITNYLIIDFDKFPIFLNKHNFEAYNNIEKAFKPLLLKPSTVDVQIGNKVNRDGNICTIINVGENEVTLLNNNDNISEMPKMVFENLIREGSIKEIVAHIESDSEQEINNIIRSANEKDLEEANRRYLVVQGMLNGADYSDFEPKERTIRDWMKKYRDAETTYGNGYVGLISNRKNQGNRTRRFQQQVIDLMNHYIINDYETIKQKKAYTVYKAFKSECENKGYATPSFITFLEELEKRPIHITTRNREGSKSAYKTEPVYYELSMTTPRHGDRPFEICHIDHTELDIELVCSETKENLGKPWVSIMIDAFSRRILAFYLTFDPPSYRSCMMVMRECVRRHSKLPNTIIVDGGKDFQSVYFDTLIARYCIGKKVRPGAKPRFGTVCERHFGTTNEMFIHNLLGNTKIMKNFRQVTKEVNPKLHAIWTLEDLNFMLEKWYYEVYDNNPHSTLGESPRETYVKRIARTGQRKNTYIKYDETFKMLTLPSTRKGTAKVIAGQGVKINHFYYFSEILLHPEIEGKSIPVRYDPFNMGVAYAYVNNYWVELSSEHYGVLENRTEKELKIATTELRRRKKIFGLKNDISSSQIIEFIESAEAYEVLKIQQLKDQAVKNSLTVISGGKTSYKESTTPINKTKNKSDSKINIGETELVLVKPTNEKASYKDILDEMKEQNSFKVYREL
ncbi:TnsA endonuclease N-terminal domain-containing protein [Bacillus sp. ISL-37]|uniref:TnsA endonuclease N-terminal domain-containing protein n=1 Tax=Bacillus sp. ISL-37 TaxID=2819123 RepID=UPI001BE736E0|nr:TnsA endonuclease N-terminal domain-containing protein [Bacillus sp. ISL-37]MBT2685308.1 DDE-type integrase/transposase/recombinase [Bacillus sp. ISL-37]